MSEFTTSDKSMTQEASISASKKIPKKCSKIFFLLVVAANALLNSSKDFILHADALILAWSSWGEAARFFCGFFGRNLGPLFRFG
jgi:hypothetical protein